MFIVYVARTSKLKILSQNVHSVIDCMKFMVARRESIWGLMKRL